MQKDALTVAPSQIGAEKVNDKMNILFMIRDRIACALDADATRIAVDCSIIGENEEILVVKYRDNIFGEKIFTEKLNSTAESYQQNFKHEVLKDYVMWFTRFGSVELKLGKTSHEGAVLFLKGLEREEAEKISFGHVFPAESSTPDILFETHRMKAPDYYCKKFVKTGFLQHFPEISYEAVFYIEGDKVKLQYNPLLIQSDQEQRSGAYRVQERYGLWLCKNYIPIERKNRWIMNRNIRSTDFHAFFNCEGLCVDDELTSCGDTPSAILEDIKTETKKIMEEIVASDDQMQFEWLIYAVCSGL
jgi:hypothetical protein